jgi:hypothetical protein
VNTVGRAHAGPSCSLKALSHITTPGRTYYRCSWVVPWTNLHMMSVCPSIVDDTMRVKPTRCYTMVYWNLRFAQHVSGIIMPIIRSLRLYRCPQRVAPHFGYGRLLVWCMAVSSECPGRGHFLCPSSGFCHCTFGTGICNDICDDIYIYIYTYTYI